MMTMQQRAQSLKAMDCRREVNQEWEDHVRRLLEEFPAGIVEREDGTVTPVQSCSHDGRNCLLCLRLRRRERFRVIFLDRCSTFPPSSWTLHTPGGNVEYLGERFFEDQDGQTLHAFSFRVMELKAAQIRRPRVHARLTQPSVFKKVIPPLCDDYVGPLAILGTTRIYVHSGK